MALLVVILLHHTMHSASQIWLTPKPRGENWMRLPPDASRLVVRQTFLNRSIEVAAQVGWGLCTNRLVRDSSSRDGEREEGGEGRWKERVREGGRERGRNATPKVSKLISRKALPQLRPSLQMPL